MDSIALIIAAAGGAVIGGTIVAAVSAARIRIIRRAVERDSWLAAGVYFSKQSSN